MPGGNSEANKAEAYLAALRAGEELKTGTIEVPVTPAEVARAAAVEAIKRVELPTTRDIDKILETVEVAPAPKIEETPVDDGAVIINERIIEAPVKSDASQPEMMEQPQQPWMGKDNRSPITTAEVVTPLAITHQPLVEVKTPVATVETVTPTTEAASVSIVPEEAPAAPQYGMGGADALREMQEAMDAPISVSTASETVSVQPEDVEASLAKGEKVTVPEPVTPAPAVEVAPAPIVEAPKETPPVVEVPKVPEETLPPATPVAGETSIPVAEVPKEIPPVAEEVSPVTPPVAEASTVNTTETKSKTALKVGPEILSKVGRSAAEKIEVVRKKSMESAHETAISMREGFGKLNEDAKKFVRRLYLTGPVGAVLGAKWRASFVYNDALVRFYGGMTRNHRLERVTSERNLMRHLRAQRDETQGLAEAATIGGNEVIPEDIAKQALANHQARDKAETYYGSSAAEASKKEQFWGEKGERFMKRRDAALEKLTRRSNELLEIVDEKEGRVEKMRTHFDELTVPFQSRLEAHKLKRDQLKFKYSEAVAAGKIKTPVAQKLMGRNSEKAEALIAAAERSLQSRAHRRGQLEQRLADLKETKKVLEGDQEKDKKLAGSKYARAIKNENARGVSEPKWQQELATADSESIPPLSADEYIRNWNWFFGSDVRIDASNFKKVTGSEATDQLPVKEWDTKFIHYMNAQNKDVPHEVVLKNLSTLRSLAASLSLDRYLPHN